MNDKRTCNDCKFAVFHDFGYSNWTVEGTNFHCAKKLHPDGDFDRFYGENPRLEFAHECNGFVEGEPINMDVESEGIADLTPDKLEIWNM